MAGLFDDFLPFGGRNGVVACRRVRKISLLKHELENWSKTYDPDSKLEDGTYLTKCLVALMSLILFDAPCNSSSNICGLSPISSARCVAMGVSGCCGNRAVLNLLNSSGCVRADIIILSNLVMTFF